jgi:hypothetical protein
MEKLNRGNRFKFLCFFLIFLISGSNAFLILLTGIIVMNTNILMILFKIDFH